MRDVLCVYFVYFIYHFVDVVYQFQGDGENCSIFTSVACDVYLFFLSISLLSSISIYMILFHSYFINILFYFILLLSTFFQYYILHLFS